MTTLISLKHALEWGQKVEGSSDATRALKRIPARLGMLDADLATLPADIGYFERQVAGQGYALVGRAKNIVTAGRRDDSRVRALLRRFEMAMSGISVDSAERDRWGMLIKLIEAEEGMPESDARWNNGKHRTFTVLQARARCAPEDLTQTEIDRIGRAVSADTRKSLRKSVTFLNSLYGLCNEMPDLRAFLPEQQLAAPAGSKRARKMDWVSFPESFRASFDAAAAACVASKHPRSCPRP